MSQHRSHAKSERPSSSRVSFITALNANVSPGDAQACCGAPRTSYLPYHLAWLHESMACLDRADVYGTQKVLMHHGVSCEKNYDTLYIDYGNSI